MKKYYTLKNKLKLESITGKSTIYVNRDFWAQILVYNMIQDIRKCADKNAAKTGEKNGNQYLMQINENIAIGLFKEFMIKSLLEKEAEKRVKMLEHMQKEMERYGLPLN